MDSQRRVVGIVSFGPQGTHVRIEMPPRHDYAGTNTSFVVPLSFRNDSVCGIPGGSPAVYTRLSAYKSWLQETICRLSDEAPLPFCNISALRCPVDTTIVGWPARLPDRTFRLLDWNDTPVISQVPPPGTTVAQGATLTVNLTQKVRLMSSSCTWKVTNPATEEMAVARFVVAPGTTSSTHPVSFYYSVPIFGREPCHVGTSYWVQRMYAQVVEPYANPVLRGRTPTSNVTVTLLTPFGERTRVPVAILHGQARSRAHVFPTPGVACLSEQGLKVAVNGWGITSSVVVEVYLYGQKMFL